MATMYCALCRRPVEARRHVGIGTAILAVFTAGLSLLAIPFYARRCSICRSAAVSTTDPDSLPPGDTNAARAPGLEQRLSQAMGELESAHAEIEQLTEELEFFRQLLPDTTHRADGDPAPNAPKADPPQARPTGP